MRSHCEAGLDSLSSVDFRNSVAKAQFDCPVFFAFVAPCPWSTFARYHIVVWFLCESASLRLPCMEQC